MASKQEPTQTCPNDLKTHLEDKIVICEEPQMDLKPKESRGEEQLLSKTKHKGPFLQKLSFTLFGYFFSIFVALELVDFYDLDTLAILGPDGLGSFKWPLLISCILLKAGVGLFGSRTRNIITSLFAMDIFLSVLTVLSFYFYFETWGNGSDVYNSHFFFIVAINLLLTSLCLLLTSFIKDKKRGFCFPIGICLSVVCNLLCFTSIKVSVGYDFEVQERLLVTFLGFCFFDAYASVYYYLVVNQRTGKYLASDYFLCYFALFIDWVSLFWKDLAIARRAERGLKDEKVTKEEKAMREDKKEEKGKKEGCQELVVPAKESSVKGAAVEKKAEDIEMKVQVQ